MAIQMVEDIQMPRYINHFVSRRCLLEIPRNCGEKKKAIHKMNTLSITK